MFARPPTNLPGKPVGTPTRSNTVVCPDCKKKIDAVKIKDGTTRCPICSKKIKIPSRKKK